MAYVNVADWKAEQVAEWLKGLDSVIFPYIGLFIEKNINGQLLLDLQPNDLEEIGVYKIGHQEIILEAIELLKNFYYDLDRENLQLLALRLSCLAHSLHNELQKNHISSSAVSTQVLADVANVVSAVKPLVCWLDRSPFCDQLTYVHDRNELLKWSLEMAMSGMRDRFVDKPVEYIFESCRQLVDLADKFIQDVDDSLLLQPSSLDLATLKKRPGDHLDFYIVPSFHGILQVGDLKCNSAAHQSGKIETGDEIVQINYQTVVGWEVKEVMSLLFEESSTEVLMTVKKRPRHSKVFGQIYIKPYRLPCKKQLNYSAKWNNDLLSPSRPELLTVPSHFRTQFRTPIYKPVMNVMEIQEPKRDLPPSPTPSTASSISSRSSESELIIEPSTPNNLRLYLPKPRIPVQRRATITGATPVWKHSPASFTKLWCELDVERQWRGNSDEKTSGKSNSEMQLKRSSPIAHSLNWSAHLCEQNDNIKTETSSFLEKSKSDNNNLDVNGIIPLKQRIDSLNRSIEQTGMSMKKPKLLPKPILMNKITNSKPETVTKSPSKILNTSKESDISPRRERGKLDKSYSTPSYDYSTEMKESLPFNMKLPEEKVKSAPDNIISEVVSMSNFKMEMCKMKKDEKLTQNAAAEEKLIQNEYLEIKSDEVESLSNDIKPARLVTVSETTDKVNKILDTINSSLLHNIDSEPEVCSKDEVSPVFRSRTNGINNCIINSNSMDEQNSFVSTNIETDSIKFEETASIRNMNDSLSISNLMQPSEKLIIHTTINVPATFPRHKMELKKPIGPPEPPPRPIKGSPINMKNTKNIVVTKPVLRNIPHKSPKAARKKNVLLTKRRNVSVKELGVCDHEGWLYHRLRKVSRVSPQWIKGWFIIKGTIFYGFNTREAAHARLMISLPGFTVSPAEEVKSRNFSFKVYHTGTTFYFAAESREDLAAWVESFQRVTISDEELSIVVSETDGEEDDDSQPTKKEKGVHETHGPHVAAMKKLSGLLSLSIPDSAKGSEKKFNSLKKNSSRKSAKDDQTESNHVASLDRKYLKFLSGSGKQNPVPVPTAQFRSYRRVPPMEKPPQNVQECSSSTDLNRSDSISSTVPVPSASPTRPPDMADYRLASLAKSNENNQRTPETSQPGGYMTLESFMLSRQEEERRHQLLHPRVTNVLRVPQCHAPPPPTPIPSHNVVAVIGRENLLPFHCNPRSQFSSQSSASNCGKNWNESFNNHSKLNDAASAADFRTKCLKKTTQYQPPPWEPPNHNHNEESRLQPAFEMTLDQNFSSESAHNNKSRKSEDSSSSTTRFKNLFGSTKTDGQKANLINSPRLRRGLFRDRKNHNHPSQQTDITAENQNVPFNNNVNLPIITVQPPEIRLLNTPDYPGLEYPPVFEPGTYSLSDVSTLLRNRRMRTETFDDSMSRQNENYFNFENENERNVVDVGFENNENNNEIIDHDINDNSDSNSFTYYSNIHRKYCN